MILSTLAQCNELLRDIIEDALVLVHPDVTDVNRSEPASSQCSAASSTHLRGTITENLRGTTEDHVGERQWKWFVSKADGEWTVLSDDSNPPTWSSVTGGVSAWTTGFRTGYTATASDPSSTFGCIAVPACVLSMFDLPACGVREAAPNHSAEGHHDPCSLDVKQSLLDLSLRRIAPTLHYFMESMDVGNCGGFGGGMGSHSEAEHIRVSHSVCPWKCRPVTESTEASSSPHWDTQAREKVYFRKALEEVQVKAWRRSESFNIVDWPLLYLRATVATTTTTVDSGLSRWYDIADLLESIGSFLDATDITLRLARVSKLSHYVCHESASQIIHRVDHKRFRNALMCGRIWSKPPRPARAVRTLLRHPLVSPQFNVLEEARLAVGLVSVVETSPTVSTTLANDVVSHRHDHHVAELSSARRSVLRRGIEGLFRLRNNNTDEELYDTHNLSFRHNVLLAATLTISERSILHDDAGSYSSTKKRRRLGPVLCTSSTMMNSFFQQYQQWMLLPSLQTMTCPTTPALHDDSVLEGMVLVDAVVDVWSHSLFRINDDVTVPNPGRWSALANLHNDGGARPLHYETMAWKPIGQHDVGGASPAVFRLVEQWTSMALGLAEIQHQQDASASSPQRSHNAM